MASTKKSPTTRSAIEPTEGPPAKKLCTERITNNTASTISKCQPEAQRQRTTVIKKCRNNNDNTVVKASVGGLKKNDKTDTESITKIQKIRLKTHDGKDLGNISIKFLTKQASSLNGKVLQLAKANDPVVLAHKSIASSKASSENSNKLLTTVSQQKLVNQTRPAIPVQSVTITPVKSNVQQGSLPKAVKHRPLIINPTKSAVPGNISEKATQPSLTEYNTGTKNVQSENQNLKKGQVTSKTIFVPAFMRIPVQKQLVIADKKNPDTVTVEKQGTQDKVIIKRNLQKPKVHPKVPQVPQQKSPIITQYKDIMPKPLVDNVNVLLVQGSKETIKTQNSNTPPNLYTPKPPLLYMRTNLKVDKNQISQPTPQNVVYVKANPVISQTGQKPILPRLAVQQSSGVNQVTPQNNIKLEPNIMFCVNKNNVLTKNLLITPQLKLNTLPVQNIMIANENKVNNNDEKLKECDTGKALTNAAVHPNAEENKKMVYVSHEGKDFTEKPDDNFVSSTNNKGNDNFNKSNASDEETTMDMSKDRNWSIIKKALNNVPDEELRVKALKALADFVANKETHVPIPAVDKITQVHEKEVQTQVFGLFDKDSFVLVKEDSPSLTRIPEVKDPLAIQSSEPMMQDASTQVQDSSFPTTVIDSNILPLSTSPSPPTEDAIDIERFFNSLCNETTGASAVKEILSPEQKSQLCMKLAMKLSGDLQGLKQWDEDGMLNIHKAVIDNNITALQRLLIVLQGCKGNIDTETSDGMSSLELAIKFDSSEDIVKTLLVAGAQPIIPTSARDSAVALASKSSSSYLLNLISHVKESALLNKTDSNGLAPIHYCSMNGNLEGVKALVAAGADINLKDNKSGRTALFNSLENNNMAITNHLLDNGADVNVEDFAGQSVLLFIEDLKNLQLTARINEMIAKKV